MVTTRLITTPQTKNNPELRQRVIDIVDCLLINKTEKGVALDWEHRDIADALGQLRVEREENGMKWGRDYFDVTYSCRDGIYFHVKPNTKATERQIQFLKDCFSSGVYEY